VKEVGLLDVRESLFSLKLYMYIASHAQVKDYVVFWPAFEYMVLVRRFTGFFQS